MSEIIVIHGPPGSGKSTQSEHPTREGLDDKQISHISAGKRVRDIRAGLVDSEFSETIRNPNTPPPTSNAVLNGIVFELMSNTEEDDLVLIDGHPRNEGPVEAFYNTIEQHSHRLLGDN